MWRNLRFRGRTIPVVDLLPFLNQTPISMMLLLLINVGYNIWHVLFRYGKHAITFLPREWAFEFQGYETGTAALQLFHKRCRRNDWSNCCQNMYMIGCATDHE